MAEQYDNLESDQGQNINGKNDHKQSHEHDHEHVAEVHDPKSANGRDPRYWQSLEEWSQDPEFFKKIEGEFQSSPLRESDGEDGWARREFLKLMGASIAMSAAAGCVRRPIQKIVPYSKQPEQITLGVPNYYTSTWFDGSEGFGLVVKSFEGRPIKVEGNPEHPVNLGGLNARAQAHIINLYDPDRLKGPKRLLQNKDRTKHELIDVKWDESDAKISAQLKKGGVAVLTGAISSPSTKQLINDFTQTFKADHIVWEAFAHEEVREGQKLSYGDAVVPEYRFDLANMIVSIDADFLGTWLTPTQFSRQYSKGRKPGEGMSRMVAFDSQYSLTGANADVRVRIKPSQQVWVAGGLLHEIIVKMGKSSYASDSKMRAALSPFEGAAGKLGIDAELFSRIAHDLYENKGKSLVVAGGLQTLTAHSKSLQVAVNLLNHILENDGKTIQAGASAGNLIASHRAIKSLIEDMKNKKVKTLIINGVNPAYVLPEESGFIQALKNVEMIISTNDRIDETSKFADYVLPDSHAMEAWSDAEFIRGVYAIQQPTIRPLHDTRSFQFQLMTWAYTANMGPARLKDTESFYDYLRSYWREQMYSRNSKGRDFETFWYDCLEKGVLDTRSGDSSRARSFKMEALSELKPTQLNDGYELVLYPSIQLGDGNFANISWLQELPDPISKICWDNYLCVSLATAEKEKLKMGSVVKLEVDGKTMNLPVHVQPGLHDGTLAIAIGYGRTAAGKVGNKVGFNTYALANWQGKEPIFSGQTATITKLAKNYELAQTQTHHSLEGRAIIIEATLKDYLKDKSAGIHKHHIWTIFPGHEYNSYKWAMSVDLNSCTGCSACVVACQSENNISTVGKKYVMKGREMHWIRIDRYYQGAADEAEALFQPMMCQHCDNAPCESVCPVLATVHSDEGLNEMVYNRCVGTRYCSNNCPYKVRRFNWFSFNHDMETPLNMALNPEVTVRIRGVMEKCTFCVQRIKDKKNEAKLEKRALKDGEIKTACEQSCPTSALVFGDMNNPESRVAKIFKEEQRAYKVLEEFNAAPSVRYLTKIRNNGKEGAHSHEQEKGAHS